MYLCLQIQENIMYQIPTNVIAGFKKKWCTSEFLLQCTGLRILCCHSCGIDRNCGLDSVVSLGSSICHGCSPKSKKTKKQKTKKHTNAFNICQLFSNCPKTSLQHFIPSPIICGTFWSHIVNNSNKGFNFCQSNQY